MTKTDRLLAAIADARRGHRITEYEDVALRLAAAAEDFLTAGPDQPTDDIEAMAYWARQVVENDGALTADSSMSLDMAHDELTKAARSYLGTPVQTRDQVLSGMQAEVISWAITKGWHGPDATLPTFGEAMALLHSEVSEALEAFRVWGTRDATNIAAPSEHEYNCNHNLNPGALDNHCDCEFGKAAKPEGVGSEFADILIRLLHYSELFGVDLAAEYLRKMTYNHTRAFRHGGRAL